MVYLLEMVILTMAMRGIVHHLGPWLQLPVASQAFREGSQRGKSLGNQRGRGPWHARGVQGRSGNKSVEIHVLFVFCGENI